MIRVKFQDVFSFSHVAARFAWKLLLRLLDLLCPPVCPVCNNVRNTQDEKGSPLCPACAQTVITPDEFLCKRCGGKRAVPLTGTNRCVRCRTVDFRFQKIIALGEYANDLRLFVLRMKTDKTGILAISAARTLVIHRCNDFNSAPPDCVVPVPMHHFRKTERGVNSPDLLAEELGRLLKIPVLRHTVRRVRPTVLQYTLSRRARAENVSGAFLLSPPRMTATILGTVFATVYPAYFGRQKRAQVLTGKHVLVVDDILTTGSTCNEVTKVLLAGGASAVTVAVLARAGVMDNRAGQNPNH